MALAQLTPEILVEDRAGLDRGGMTCSVARQARALPKNPKEDRTMQFKGVEEAGRRRESGGCK